jgi:hypothetical protein
LIKHEQKFTTDFKKWLEGTTFVKGSAAFELKVTLGPSIAFDAFEPHQLLALRRTKHGRFSWKIADDSIGVKPYDVFFFDSAQAYVVIAFKRNGRIKSFWIVDIDSWDECVLHSKKKSITEAELRAKMDGVWEHTL